MLRLSNELICSATDSTYSIVLKGYANGEITLEEIWKKNNDDCIKYLSFHIGPINTLTIGNFQDDIYIISGGDDEYLVVWKNIGFKWEIDHEIKFEHKVTSVAFSYDNNYLAIATSDGIVRFFIPTEIYLSKEVRIIDTKYTGMIRIGMYPRILYQIENQRYIEENPDNTAFAIVTNEGLLTYFTGDDKEKDEIHVDKEYVNQIKISSQGYAAVLISKPIDGVGVIRIVNIFTQAITQIDVPSKYGFPENIEWNQSTNGLMVQCDVKGESKFVFHWIQLPNGIWVDNQASFEK